MKMEFLELPFEAIVLRFHVATAAASLAVAVAAAVGLWRIRAVGSRSDASSSLSAPSSLVPSPETEPSRPVRAYPAPTQPSRIRPCAAPKERFTAYYGGDESYGDEEEEHVGVDGEMTAPLVGGAGFGWEVNGDVRRGISDLRWYRYQDLTVINGSVVRLWDGDGELTPLTPLSRRRWRGRTGISHSF